MFEIPMSILLRLKGFDNGIMCQSVAKYVLYAPLYIKREVLDEKLQEILKLLLVIYSIYDFIEQMLLFYNIARANALVKY